MSVFNESVVLQIDSSVNRILANDLSQGEGSQDRAGGVEARPSVVPAQGPIAWDLGGRAP